MRPRRTIAALATATAAVTITALGVAPTAASAAPTDLFISEYVEGSSNNKAIELFNGTGAPSTWPPAATSSSSTSTAPPRPTTIALTGTVAAGDVFVFASRLGRRRRSSPRPTRPPARACSTATTRSCCAGATHGASTRSARSASTRAPSGAPA